MRRPIYLDHHATTPLDPRVFGAMAPVLKTHFGNAASRHHAYGLYASELVENARSQVARLIGAESDEIIFTSGATESNNLAIKGAAEMYKEKGNHVISCVTEHKSVLAACRRLEESGFTVTYLRVPKHGRLDPASVKTALTPKTTLITVMAANNEIGVLHPLNEIGRIAKEAGVLFHTDATQAVGKIPIDVTGMGIDLMSFSAHKMYGPKGIGALYVRKKNPRVRLRPLVDGGGHERGLRSGTLNVPGIVGFGSACQICREVMPKEMKRLSALKDRLMEGLLARIDGAVVNGSLEHRLPHNLNMSFPYVESESLIKALPGIAVTSGAACASAVMEASYVLKEIGLPEELAHGSIRFGLGRFNTRAQIDTVIGEFTRVIRKLRKMSPLYRMAGEGRLAKAVEWNDGTA